ncbi:hypothetical protein CYMTET_18033 [Cymbomonas tetramitiformis]|uniref:Uncharacterized protein n=1 Tax=Cymbomonas tetramitiformis TaxID=36881 RepID=A0AAE0GA74_9CHLO|nr:hypothetical protein CYMTET_18033 [Cymbomonas tetramitiformis]
MSASFPWAARINILFEAAKDSEKLSKILVVLKNEFSSAGLDLSSFDLDDLAKAVISKVNELLYDSLAYIVGTDSAAEHFLHGTDSVSDRDGRRALLDLIKGCVPPGVRQTLQEEHSQLRYPARVDPRPLLAKKQRLVRDNRSEDWTPTESTRKYRLYERLDPDFYAAVRVRYPMPAEARSSRPRAVVDAHESCHSHFCGMGTAAGGAGSGGEARHCWGRLVLRRRREVLGLLTSRLEKIEAAIKFQKTGGEAALPRNRRGKGLDGFRAGSTPTPPVGFDRVNRRALPLCHRCGREGEGKKYHGYKECPYGGKNAAGTAAYCMPADGEGADEAMRTLALCQIFRVAADDGADAFAAAVADGVLSELEAVTGQVRAMEERVGVHLSQVSLVVEGEDVIGHRAPVGAPSANAVASGVPQQVVPPAGGASAGGALATGGYMAHVHPATEEFPGGVEMIPVRSYV